MKNNSNKNITDKLQTSYRQVTDKPNILDTKWTNIDFLTQGQNKNTNQTQVRHVRANFPTTKFPVRRKLGTS